MEQFFANYPIPFNNVDIKRGIDQASSEIAFIKRSTDILKQIFGCIDLTTLNTTDSALSVREFCKKVNGFSSEFPEMPNVAAVCVYPVFSPVLKSSLTVNHVNKAVVAAGFPSSQTFTDIKIQEIKKSVELGVDEVDVVISVGEFLDGNYEFILEEIRLIKDAAGYAHLKVILETGLLLDIQSIWRASLLAMEGGADFIKTSTGKSPVSATPEAAFVMLSAILAFSRVTGKKVGFKPAGGIVTTEDAVLYYNLVKNILGNDWLNSQLFRIGASRLANNLLSDITFLKTGEKKNVSFF